MTAANGWLNTARREQTRNWMQEIIQQGLRQRFDSDTAIRARMDLLECEVAEGRTTSFRAARILLEMYAALQASGNSA